MADLMAAMAAGHPGSRAPLDEIVERATTGYLDLVDPLDPPEPIAVVQHLLGTTNALIAQANVAKPKGSTDYPDLRSLSFWQIAHILMRLHRVILVRPSTLSHDRDYDVLAMYEPSGEGRGTYTTSESRIREIARQYCLGITTKDWESVALVLRESAPRHQRCLEQDLVAVNNGIFYYGSTDADLQIEGRTFSFHAKSLHPFDPDLIFLSKIPHDLDLDAPNPVITMPDGQPWDIVSWIDEMFDDPTQQGMTELMWQIIGALTRPLVRWNKSAWFYSDKGNNGKGSICQLMRHLVGMSQCAALSLEAMGRDFRLEPLLSAGAIICDENDVGAFIDRAANLKTIQTNDILEINRKHRTPVAFQFWGFMVQCLNGMPRFKDKSESFYRRQLFVPFAKSFTGHERSYIKQDYLTRPEVLQFVLRHVLVDVGDYYQFDEPPATCELMDEYKVFNDPVREFWEEFNYQYTWDLLPFSFLYDHFCSWFARANRSGSVIRSQQFVPDLLAVVEDDPMWTCRSKNRKIRPRTMMDDPEPLIAEYELKSWYTPGYQGSDPLARSQPLLKSSYRGLERVGIVCAPDPADRQTTDPDED
jgi:putative DNA primase/helicase